jgi:Tfp pilus assembly protein PilN
MNPPSLDDHERNQQSRDTRMPEQCRRSTRARPLTWRFARLPILLSVLLAFCCRAATARAEALPPAAPQAESQQQSAQQLVRDVVWNEIQAQKQDQRHWRFHETQWKSAGRKMYDVIQTKYGNLHRLLAIDGKPLQGKALEVENKRIQRLSSEPDQIAAAQKRRDADARQEQRLLRMLPPAFIFHRVSQQGDTVTLSFVPNPNFRPSTHEAEVFHHMEGTMLVDARMKRLLQIDGRLTSPVEFWGGLLGHLDAGGTFKVEQRDVGEGHWDMVYLHVEMNGKALFFKTISVHQQEAYSDYRLVPEDLTPRQAARELQEDVELQRDRPGQ